MGLVYRLAATHNSRRCVSEMRRHTVKEALLSRGVRIIEPQTVEIAADVDPARIAPAVIIHAGCRIRGAATSIGPGSVIGAEGPATVENCQISARVELKGGFYCGAVFWDGVTVGNEAHIRPGTIMEEEAKAAHAVGMKQTILFPFVTAGSLINFCDCLMAGGTSRKNHSEIGSCFVHFNFTPHGDKATASLIGDVPRGVMLDQDPVFLGGAAGLVGPARISYGCVLPAGLVFRGDALQEGQLLGGKPVREHPRAFYHGAYREIRRLVRNNIEYLANVIALLQWYQHVRRESAAGDPYREACRRGGLSCLGMIIEERLNRLARIAARMDASAGTVEQVWEMRQEAADQRRFADLWTRIREIIHTLDAEQYGALERDKFLEIWRRTEADGHVERVRRLASQARRSGTEWLQQIVSAVLNSTGEILGWW